jgi:DNA-binding transcriptional LysR family regulator
MDIKELKAFILLAEELNFTRAAERFGISQPPFTRMIKQMESHLGVPLFKRSTRNVELTGEGVYLLQKAKTILRDVQEVESNIQIIGHKKNSKLAISLSPASIHSNLPRIISSFKEHFPRIDIDMNVHSGTVALKKLKAGEVDVIFGTNELFQEKIEQFELQSHELGILVSLDNPLSKKKNLTFRQLENQTLIFHGKKDALGFQKEFHDFLGKNEIKVKIYFKKEHESCSNLAVLGKGLLITSKVFVHHEKNAVFIPFSDYQSRLKIFSSWVATNPSLALSAFLSFIKSGYKNPYSHTDQHLA